MCLVLCAVSSDFMKLTPLENVSVRAFLSWTKSDSSVAVAETGDFEAFNAGTGLNLIYRF